MHIVFGARDDEAHGWQLREVTRELAKIPFGLASAGERFPWIMFTRRAGLDIADKALPSSLKSVSKIGRVESVVPIVAYALRRSTKERKIIRLAWMRDSEGVDEQCAA